MLWRKDEIMYGIDEKRKEIIEFTEKLSEEEAHQKPAEEKWSILEILEHLYLMEEMVVYRMKQSLKQGDLQQATEKPVHKTVDRTRKVEAPESVQPKGEFESLEEAMDRLEKTREATMFLIHNKDKEVLQNRIYPHPSFGDMNLEQWVEFIGWHELRHLEQMKEVKQKIS
ncbi:DinB family protein [Halobacillus yeomjeoni]|nr:DinB family protein [Halobacillus yeomjeoni]